MVRGCTVHVVDITVMVAGAEAPCSHLSRLGSKWEGVFLLLFRLGPHGTLHTHSIPSPHQLALSKMPA